MIGTSEKIIQQDKISVSSSQKESVISWRNTDFVVEFAFDDGFEVERPIKSNELPSHIKPKYSSLLGQYDRIYLEKVYSFGKNIPTSFIVIRIISWSKNWSMNKNFEHYLIYFLFFVKN
ncbi:hypothetical protein [Chryseobacterium indoltheticum]|uniref:hypothetical protein n=1 Tax=Chryseobacterium indoltheticum TaxID=254 RepID=UPI003F494EF8